MTSEVFLDTGYTIALSVESDEHHERAEALAEQLEAEQTRLITTQAILLETGNALSKKRFRKSAIELLDALEEDPLVEIVPLSENLFAQAIELFRNRPDKEWGLVDCVSFIVMQERGLTEALTPENTMSKQDSVHYCVANDDVVIDKLLGHEGYGQRLY